MFLMQGDIKKLFNTSGLLYKSLKLKEKLPLISNEDALKLLSNHGMLIKRPFILTDTKGCTGFNPKIWNQLFLI
jgi:arsenate reductase-like glutaredoxin family protein